MEKIILPCRIMEKCIPKHSWDRFSCERSLVVHYRLDWPHGPSGHDEKKQNKKQEYANFPPSFGDSYEKFPVKLFQLSSLWIPTSYIWRYTKKDKPDRNTGNYWPKTLNDVSGWSHGQCDHDPNTLTSKQQFDVDLLVRTYTNIPIKNPPRSSEYQYQSWGLSKWLASTNPCLLYTSPSPRD